MSVLEKVKQLFGRAKPNATDAAGGAGGKAGEAGSQPAEATAEGVDTVAGEADEATNGQPGDMTEDVGQQASSEASEGGAAEKTGSAETTT